MPQDSGYQDKTNEKVAGKVKDETQRQPIVEFVGLRPKIYICKMGLKEKHTGRQITRAAAKELRHNQFTSQLTKPMEIYVVNLRIGAKLH